MGKHLLIALGIISLIGALVATGCLYSQLGDISFTIGGAGLILGLLCCALSRQIGLVKHQSELLICNRLPFRHEGNSCFVNTAMQIMAHLSEYRYLFDKDRTKLEERFGKNDPSLIQRQKVQEIGSRLIQSILEGKQAENLGNFVSAVNSALQAMENSFQFDLENLSNADRLISHIESILIPNSMSLAYGFDLDNPDHLKKDLQDDPSTILRSGRYGSHSYLPEIVIDGIGTYRLEAMIVRTGNHAKPIIRSQDGKFFELDDVVGKAVEVSESSLSDILLHNDDAKYLTSYYVKITL